MPLQVLLSSIGLISITEFGDKTMITAMCLSAQYRRPWIVLLATMIALTISTLIAIIIGIILSAAIPVDILVYVSGLLFLGLGIYTLTRSNSEEVDTCETPSSFLSMVSLVLFSELGDKSQIAILALAVQSAFPIMVFIGAIVGFLMLNILAVFAGNSISGKVSIKLVKRVAGLLFILFGILVIFGII
ncbi:MAG: TMEM165/GDT1 family protein [Candidatus Thorarchaeota archaeon]|nr:TMEM165/GDT1 family protein [Candidatus Thorarchaeota archaeon]